MDAVSFSEAKASLERWMDHVVRDCAPVIITRDEAEPVVLVPLSEWNSITETLRLLSSPRNAERLRTSVGEFDGRQSE